MDAGRPTSKYLPDRDPCTVSKVWCPRPLHTSWCLYVAGVAVAAVRNNVAASLPSCARRKRLHEWFLRAQHHVGGGVPGVRFDALVTTLRRLDVHLPPSDAQLLRDVRSDLRHNTFETVRTT